MPLSNSVYMYCKLYLVFQGDKTDERGSIMKWMGTLMLHMHGMDDGTFLSTSSTYREYVVLKS